jgi:glycolate oxidase FAD binding subunit
MTDVIAASLADVKDAVESAIAAEHRLEVRGTGSKSNLGRACDFDATLDVSQMAGIVDYQPEELVMTLRAGTPMDVVENALADARQMLAFEPPRMGRISGGPRSELHGTIGGVVAANLSGPRRLTAGATRDYLLGFEAISGRGELFKSGGRVMKNVTGYDLSKLMCGSFGTLAVMDEITLKTLPAPETSQSLLVACADFRAAIKTIAQIFATPHEPGAAAILPQAIAAEEKVDTGGAFTAIIRLEGIAGVGV